MYTDLGGGRDRAAELKLAYSFSHEFWSLAYRFKIIRGGQTISLALFD